MKQVIIYRLAIVIVCMLSCLANAKTNQTTTQHSYPPYSKVWGYDLSGFPAMQWGQGNVKAYAMNDGDIWFVVDYSYKESQLMAEYPLRTDEKYMLIKFFKKEQREISAQEKQKLLGDKPEIKAVNELRFSDQSKLEICYQPSSVSYIVPDFCRNYFIKTDAQGQEKKYSILVASPQVEIYPDQMQDAAQGALFFYQRLHLLTQMIPLKDDTFLVFEKRRNLILRLDKNLKTHFKVVSPVMIFTGKYIMRNFFIMDYSLISHLVSSCIQQPEPLYQSVHNALLVHLSEQYPRP